MKIILNNIEVPEIQGVPIKTPDFNFITTKNKAVIIKLKSGVFIGTPCTILQIYSRNLVLVALKDKKTRIR